MLNALLLSPSPENIAGMLLQHPAFFAVYEADTVDDAIRFLREGIDVVFLDGADKWEVSGSFLTWMHAQNMVSPPRLIALTETLKQTIAADGSIGFPCIKPELDHCLEQAFSHPVGILAKASFEARWNLASALLCKLGMKQTLKGYAYIHYGVVLLSCFRRNDIPMNNWLYPQIAKRFGTTASSVERCIRTAVESTWLHGDLAAIQHQCGYSVDANRGKATNAEFMYMLRNAVQLELLPASSI